MIRSMWTPAVVVWSVPEHQVAGLRGLDGDGDGLQVAHLAHQDDVGSSRSAARRACLKLRVWSPTCRCVTRHFLLW
jgi:hypothetical protein